MHRLLVPAAACFVAALGLTLLFPLGFHDPRPVALALSTSGAFLVLVSWLSRRPRLLLGASALAGVSAAIVGAPAPSLDPPWIAGAGPIGIEARVLRVRERPGDAPSVDVELSAVHRYQRWFPARARARLRAPPGILSLPAGTRFRARARLWHTQPATNPGAFDEQEMLGRQGLSLRGSIMDAPGLLALAATRDPPPWLAARRRLDRAIRHDLLPGPGRSLLRALTLGRADALDPELRESFGRAGIAHLLAISGLHVALVALGLFGLLRRLLLGFGVPATAPAALLAAPTAFAFAAFTGSADSALRAAAMALLALFARAATRRYRPAAALALAALVLLAIDPQRLLRPGFLLSFAAAGAILHVATRPTREGLPGRLTAVARVTSSAWLATVPIAASVFGRMSLVAPLSNLVAVPLASLLLPAALLGGALLLAAPSLGAPWLEVVTSCLETFAGATSWTAQLPLASVRIAPLAFPIAALWCGASLLLSTRRSRRLLPGLLTVAGFVIALVGPSRLERWLAGPRLRATFLDVGQGDATLLELPDGRSMLIDGGGRPFSRSPPGAVGRHTVVPALHARGLTSLDVVVATHGDADHVRGLVGVLGEIPVGELWTTGDRRQPRQWGALLRAARDAGVPVRVVGRDVPWRTEMGDLALEWLHPRCPETFCKGLGGNDNSLVLRVEIAGYRILLPGDIEAPAEARLLETLGPGALRADVLKAPHHGSGGSSTEAFLGAVRPLAYVVSAGRGNRFGLPHAGALERARGVGATVLRTDQQGAVTLVADATGLTMTTPLSPGTLRLQRFVDTLRIAPQ